jgi:hypothetical protein
MDGLHELTAPTIPTTIGGRTYYLQPLRARDWAEAAQYLNARRKSPLEVIREKIKGFDDEAQRRLLELAYRDERDGALLDMQTVEWWFRTAEGGVYRFWLLVRRSHPEITLELAEQILLERDSQEADAMERSAQTADGMPLGNSSGPP